jgi:hypothetical protein
MIYVIFRPVLGSWSLIMGIRAALCLLAIITPVAIGQEKQSKVDWREEAKVAELKPAQIELLAKQQIVLGDDSYKQIFSAYLGGSLPYFITSDSVLNGFHVLLEESIYRMERMNAEKLPAYLEAAVARLDEGAKGLPANAEILSASKRRAEIFLGTALRILKPATGKFDEATTKLIQVELDLVLSAKETNKPAWLGMPDPGFVALDYTRFTPRGFYTRSDALKRYFRCVAWLQAIPFRVEKEEELLAALILFRAQNFPEGASWDAARKGKQVLDSFGEFLGTGDDWNLQKLSYRNSDIDRKNWGDQPMIRWLANDLLKDAKDKDRPQINDRLAFQSDDPKATAEVSIRVATPYRLPDGVLFQRLLDSRTSKPVREWPSGLDVATALDSPYARKHLLEKDGNDFVSLIDDQKKILFFRTVNNDDELGWRERPSVYKQYLICLGTLTAVEEPDWPPFMKGDAWKAKQCQTALSGWAQMRHTWLLQAKLNVHWMSSFRSPIGFVEPVPEFYRKLGQLTERLHGMLHSNGAFEAENARKIDGHRNHLLSERYSIQVLNFDELIAILEKANVAKIGVKGLEKLSDKEKKELRELATSLVKSDPLEFVKDEQFTAYLEKLRKEREEVARLVDNDLLLAYRWLELREVCTKLEILSHKQLRNREFSADEATFIRHFGTTLAGIMFYEGNSYIQPRDDAPRIADVYSKDGRHLQVGIARPQPLYVLYPWKGQDVLCRGAVMPYREFISDQRLTDETWRGQLYTPQKPPLPAWIRVLTEGKAK